MLGAEEKGLQAQKEDAFGQITQAANRRGMFYSGLPIAEEQRYTGQQYLPAIANLRGKYASQKFGLQDALAKIVEDQYKTGQGIYQQELDRDAQQREFDRQLAAQASARAASGGGGWSPTFTPDALAKDPRLQANKPAVTQKDIERDIGNAFQGFDQREPTYTENVIIPKIRDQYGLSWDRAAEMVYNMRKRLGFEGIDGGRIVPSGGGGGWTTARNTF